MLMLLIATALVNDFIGSYFWSFIDFQITLIGFCSGQGTREYLRGRSDNS